MIKIAVVDDEEMFILSFQKDLDRLFKQNNVDFLITSFTNGNEFMASYEEAKYDLVFLDIDIPYINGIEIASAIRSKKINTELIFVSGHDNFVFESICYAPFRFIRKAELLLDTEEAVFSFCKKAKNNERTISLELEENNIFFDDISKIIYIFSQRHDIFILNDKKETLRLSSRLYTMDGLEELISSRGFIRIHKSYLVNYLYIYKIQREKILLKDSTDIPLSRGRTAKVKEKYNIFLRRNDTL